MVTLTPSALEQVAKHLELRADTLGIRLGVKSSGCNGFSYVLESVDQPVEGDTVVEAGDIKIVLDPKSLVVLNGTELDYTRQGLNEGFEFNNPNVKAECGCGESFTI
jgi:iron-sulfur cluster assembly protein